MTKPMDVKFHNTHGFYHGTMGKATTWQNPDTMTFAMVYVFCHTYRDGIDYWVLECRIRKDLFRISVLQIQEGRGVGV